MYCPAGLNISYICDILGLASHQIIRWAVPGSFIKNFSSQLLMTTPAQISEARQSGQEDIAGIFDFLKICYNLKRTKRSGWLLRGHSDCESIADHMYMISVMALILADNDDRDGRESIDGHQPAMPRLNRSKCIQMALVDDMAEAIIGDFTPERGISMETKRKLERDAIHSMTTHLGVSSRSAQHIIELWAEYEAGETAEAQFVKDLDRFELALQAYFYEGTSSQLDFSDFIQNVQPKLRHPKIIALYEKLVEMRLNDHMKHRQASQNINQ